MKNILTIIICLFMGQYFAQQLPLTEKVNITWGEDIKMKKSYFDEVILAKGGDIYMSKWTKGELSIEVFNTDMKSVKEVSVDLDYGTKKRVSVEGIVPFGNEIVLLGSYSDKKTKENKLFYKSLDKKNLTSGKGWTELASLTFEKRRRNGSFSYNLSRDSSKLLLYYSLPVLEKDAPSRFGFKVFSENMKMDWEKETELGFGESLFAIQGYKVANSGDVYLIGQEFDPKENKLFSKSEPSARKYHILSYQNEGKNYKDYKISLKDKFINDIAYSIKGDELICAGFYSLNGRNSIVGTFYLTIDLNSQNVNKSSFKEIPEDFITENWTEKQVKKAKKKESKKGKNIEAYEFDLRDFVLKEDGGATLLAEQYYVHVVTTTTTDANGNTTTKTTYHYYYNDVYIIDISPEGNINWLSKVEKSQHSINDGGYRSSYSLHIKDDKMYLMFNLKARDYYEKAERKEMSKKEKKAYLTFISEVDSKGNVEDEILINNSEEETYVIPKFCVQISDAKTLIYTSKGKTQRMGIAVFK